MPAAKRRIDATSLLGSAGGIDSAPWQQIALLPELVPKTDQKGTRLAERSAEAGLPPQL